jgi:hypothetical protein
MKRALFLPKKKSHLPVVVKYDFMISKDKVIQDLKEIKSNKGFPDNIKSAIYGSNCIGVLTEWGEFKQYDRELIKQKNIPIFKHMIS